MKQFKKLLLVTAIAAPFSSVQALEALEDSVLSGMTGQSGVTIDLQTQISIDELAWIDTQTVDDVLGGGIGGGAVYIGGIKIGGADTSTVLDNLRLKIDSGQEVVLSDGSATLAGKDALKIEVTSQDLKTVDLGIDVAYFALGGHANARISNLTMDVELGPQAIVIHEDSFNSAHIDISGYFKITDLDVDLNAWSAEVRNVAVGDIDWANSTLSGDASSHYAWNQGALRTRLDTLKLQIDDGKTQTLASIGLTEKSQLEAEIADLESRPSLSIANQQRLEIYKDVLGRYEVLEGKEVAVNEKFAANSDNGTDLNQTAAGMSFYSLNVGTTKLDRVDIVSGQVIGTYDALKVDVNYFQTDIGIGDIAIGQESIGSLAIDNLSLTNTSLVVFGR